MSTSSVIEACAKALGTAAFALLAARASADDFAGSRLITATAAELAATIEARRVELEADPYSLYELVDTLLLPRFDMRRGSRGILARRWASTATDDRERFVTAFYNYLVASYGTLLLHFKADTLRVLPFAGDPAVSPARVSTVLTMNDGTEVDVDFVMVKTAPDDAWKIVDVVAEGVSYVKTYRSQFNVDIATDGLESVLEWLEDKGAPRFRPRE